MQNRTIVLSAVDHQRLEAMVRDAVASGSTRRDLLLALQGELDRAQIVKPEEVPADVVTMNSTVVVRDLDDQEVETYSLVYPGFADISKGCLSVLTPMGMAILGYRVGDVIEWEFPVGIRHVRIEEVRYQPERSGQYDV
jgi:regulator of nucleoside diphosphate kinase